MPKNLTPEGIVTKQCKDFLALRKWRGVRMQRTAIPGAFSTGEPGIPDFLFLHYLPSGVALALWIEFKAPGKKTLRPDQETWHRNEKLNFPNSRIWIVDDFDQFERNYSVVYGWLEDERLGLA